MTLSNLQDNGQLRRLWDVIGRREAYLVGGSVRDRLLGCPSADLDLALPGDPEGVAAAARRLGRALGCRAHLLGTPPRAVWRIDSPTVKIELWPLGELDLEADIRRRDFTCNALMWSMPDGPLIDRVGGVRDIEHRLIRAISRSNLERDPVRLVRACRFLAQLELFELEQGTRAFIQELAPEATSSPRERIGHELLVMMRANAPQRALRAMLDLGLWQALAPCPTDSGWLRHSFMKAQALGARSRAVRRMSPTIADAVRVAFILRAWSCDLRHDLSGFAWPRGILAQALTAAALLEEMLRVATGNLRDRRQLIFEAGDAFPVALALASVLEPELPRRRWHRQWLRLGERLITTRALISAAEVAATAGIGPGPALGRWLRRLTVAQVRGEVRSASGARRWLHRQLEISGE